MSSTISPIFNNENINNINKDRLLALDKQQSLLQNNLKNRISFQEKDQNFNLIHQDAFIEAHFQSNKELIKQLKSNIELLFKGTLIAGRIILFPFSALRWQCQIHSESLKYHLTPITLMPVIFNLNYNGFYTLWKGSFSMTVYNGIQLISESVLSELVSFEKNIKDVTKPNKLYGHGLLKLISTSITTPIFSAVIYESVQSRISYENVGLLDLMKETYNRITGYKYNYRTRLIPIWYLLAPTSFYFVGLHFISYALEKIIFSAINFGKKVNKKRKPIYEVDEIESEVVETPYLNTLSQLISQISAIIILYPVETVLNRLIVQGTRTIIDNTDNGLGVIPINTRYDGFFDCAYSIHETEGVFGFYKGIGSLIIETGFQLAFLKLVKEISKRIFDSEWSTRTDLNNLKNLMSSTSLS